MLPVSSNFVRKMKSIGIFASSYVLFFFRPIVPFFFCEVSKLSVFVEMESAWGFLTSFLEVDISKGCLGCISQKFNFPS